MKHVDVSGVFLKCAVWILGLMLTVPAFGDSGDPPGRVARLSYAPQGQVSLQPSGETEWSQASTNYTLTTGDRLYTEQGGRAELEVGPFAVRMSDTTDLTIANLTDEIMQLGLGQGSIRISVYELPSNNSIEIDTPNGALTILRAGSYRVDTDPNRNSTLIIVNSGSLEVSGGGISQPVQGGQAVQLNGADPIQVNRVKVPNQDEFDQWSATRDRRIQSLASRQYVNPYTPGAADLDAYGRWQTAAEYGPVWYPSGVPAGWVPYRYGRWVWVEPWGWTWVENEPWGFCPFHYGRWAFVGSRWGWVPGPVAAVPVYAPALVAFVGGGGLSVGVRIGGVGLAAWFPLGPREPFVPWYHHGGNYLRQVNVTNVRNVTNITNITNVTNVNNIRYANRNVATTAVPANVFRSGQPIARQMVRVAPQQLERAQVVAHPGIAPAQTALYGGRAPLRTPPVRTARIVAPPAGTQVGVPAGSVGGRSGGPAINRNQSPADRRGGMGLPPNAAPVYRGAPAERTPTAPATVQPAAPTQPPSNANNPRENIRRPPNLPPNMPPVFRNAPITPGPTSRPAAQPPVPNRSAPPAAASSPGGPPNSPRVLIRRSPPPQQDVPFSAHQRGLSSHPGRPLEPQEERNLRMGRQPGPTQNREARPRPPAAAPQARPAAPPRQQERQMNRGARPESPREQKR